MGGIELETVVLGEPYILPKPEFVGVRLDGTLADGMTVTDVALTLTEQLRAADVVGAWVEFFGSAAGALTGPLLSFAGSVPWINTQEKAQMGG